MLAFRAMAILAVLAAVGTGALMALSHRPQTGPVGVHGSLRHRVRVIAAADAGGGAEPIAAVIPPETPPEPAPWPPPLLNPMGHLRAAWDLSMGRPNAREVLFTFDDGPNPGTTNRLLPILERAGIHACLLRVRLAPGGRGAPALAGPAGAARHRRGRSRGGQSHRAPS